VYSYPIADSANGGIKISSIINPIIDTEADYMNFDGSLPYD
jgi:hypothetical protein